LKFIAAKDSVAISQSERRLKLASRGRTDEVNGALTTW